MERIAARTESFEIPVDGRGLSHSFDKLVSDLFKRLVAQLEHRGIVLHDRVVEGDLVFTETKFFVSLWSSRICLASLTSSAMISAVVSERFVYRLIASSSNSENFRA